jgi:V/A-type H+-transporting ATPase subunit E
MSLESILNHIIAQGDSQKEKIIQESGRQAQGIIQNAKEEADKLYQEIIDREKSLYLAEKQKRIVNARLEARKNLLRIKQELIDLLFEELKSQLAKEKFKKRQVFLNKELEVPEDIDFYLAKIRVDYESEIARHLF